MLKTLVASLAVLPTISAFSVADTISLDCTYQNVLDVERQSNSVTTGNFSAHVQSTENGIAGAIVKDAWCDPRSGLLSEMEISFACAIDMAGQRFSYTVTFNRLNSLLEQRFFIGGKLRLIYYGQCKVARK
ncbi:MAG TPA: hypothetical protein VH933_00065 [Aestuariivirgaceae bacterium]|jgi:hypothetical protein